MIYLKIAFDNANEPLGSGRERQNNAQKGYWMLEREAIVRYSSIDNVWHESEMKNPTKETQTPAHIGNNRITHGTRLRHNETPI